MQKGIIILLVLAVGTSCLPGPAPVAAPDVNDRAQPVSAKPVNIARDEAAASTPRDPGVIPPGLVNKHWAVVCHETWTNQNCVGEPFGYRCTKIGVLGRYGPTNHACDEDCGCTNTQTGQYKDGGGRSVYLGRELEVENDTHDVNIRNTPRDSGVIPRKSTKNYWIVICSEFPEECVKMPFEYRCTNKGVLGRHGSSFDACDRKCSCYNTKTYETKESGGKSIQLRRKREVENNTRNVNIRSTSRDAKKHPAPPPAMVNNYWTPVCRESWTSHTCIDKPFQYRCTDYGQLGRYGKGNHACDNDCGCTNVSSPKYRSSGGRSIYLGHELKVVDSSGGNSTAKARRYDFASAMKQYEQPMD